MADARNQTFLSEEHLAPPQEAFSFTLTSVKRPRDRSVFCRLLQTFGVDLPVSQRMGNISQRFTVYESRIVASDSGD